jgi:hypothetical protein
MNATINSSKIQSVADFYGLTTLADGEPTVDPELLRALYRHARGEDGGRELLQNLSYSKGWVNLASIKANELVSGLVALDDADTLKQARRIAQSNLEAQAWNDLLNIEEPPIKCEIKIHGNQWAIRFRKATPCRKGEEVLNEQLPPILNDSTAPGTSRKGSSPIGGTPYPGSSTQPTTVSTPTTSTPAPATGPDAAVEAALREAGFPQ